MTGQHCEQIMFERTNMPKKEEKKDAASAAKVHMVRFPVGHLRDCSGLVTMIPVHNIPCSV